MIDWVDDETIKDLLTPNVWKNYMARNSDLEELTFSQMVMEYQWWSSISHVPAYWKRIIDKISNFYEQWSFNKLKKYREDQDKINNIEESDVSREMRRQQTKVCLDDKNQLAKYWYKKKNRSLFNWIYKLKREKDELYFFILLIDYVPFRSFWELLCFNNRVYDSFQEICEERGLLDVRDCGVHLNNQLMMTNVDKQLSLYSSGAIMLNILDF